MEEPLAGGNSHGSVVRIGSTVRRPTGTWTPAVHATLRHLEQRGFPAPRVLGIDAQGREMLTYVDGTVVWPDHVELVATSDALAAVARTIRSYHDALDGFDVAGHPWSERGRDPTGSREVLCHNDLGPWNLVHGHDGGWTFIDWDLVAPGRRSWDVSLALLGIVPLMHFSTLTEDETRARLTVFRDAYGPDRFPVDALDVAVERCAIEARVIAERGGAGEEPFVRLLAEGHADTWSAAAAHVEHNRSGWATALSA